MLETTENNQRRATIDKLPFVQSVTAGTGLINNGSPTEPIIDLEDVITSGSFTNADITVNAQGQVIAASNGTGGGTGTVTSVSGGIGLSGTVTTSGDIDLDIDTMSEDLTSLPSDYVAFATAGGATRKTTIGQMISAVSGSSAEVSTGILTGGNIIDNGGTTVTLEAGTGQVNYGGVVTSVTWSDDVHILPDNKTSYMWIDNAGNHEFDDVIPTALKRRTHIFIGVAAVISGDIVEILTLPNPLFNPLEQVYDFAASLGIFNITGNTFEANGATLELAKNIGRMFQWGSNYTTSVDDPHRKEQIAETQISFVYYTTSGPVSTNQTVVDPSNYDNAGAVTPISGNNKWTIQRIYLTSNNIAAIEYGQTVYDSLNEAKDALTTEQHVRTLSPGILLRCLLIVKKSTTNLQDTTQNIFYETDRFGESSLASGSASASITLQSAYNNSSQPQILTDTIRGALQIRNGNALDSDFVTQVLDKTNGDNMFGVTGEGHIIAGNVDVDMVTAPTTGQVLTATSTTAASWQNGATVVANANSGLQATTDAPTNVVTIELDVDNLQVATPVELTSNVSIAISTNNSDQRKTSLAEAVAAGGAVTSVAAGTGLSDTGTAAAPILNIADTAVTPDTYTLSTVVVNQQGQVTSASNAVLAGGQIFVGDISGAPTPVNMTGDASLSSTGVITLQKEAITDQLSASAASGDLVLIADISDGDNLKHTTIQDLVTAGGGGATNLSEGLVSNIAVDINSSTGTSATLAAASTSRAGVMTKAKFDEVVANNAKVTNATHTGDASGSTTLTLQPAAITGKNLASAASNDLVLIADISDGDNLKHTTIQDLVTAGGGGGATNLSEGLVSNIAVDINSSTGTSATLAAASTSRAGVMTKAKFDEVVANNAKVTNATHTGDASGSTTLTLQPAAITGKNLASAASNDLVLIADISDGDNLKHTTIQDIVTAGGGGATNLSEGLVSNITVDINSSTGTSATLAAASTARAGVMTKAKFDEVVANNAKVTNATHTGDASGSTTLTLQPEAITGKNLASAASNDLVLIADISDGDNLKHTTIQDLVTAGGGGATNLSEGLVSNIAVDINSSTGTSATLAAASTARAGVMTKAKFDEVVANNAKVTNATHTGDASGSTTLTLQPAAITGKNLASAASNDLVLIADISDGDNLKHTTIQDLVTAGGGGATNLSEGLVSNISVDINSSTGTSATLAAASTARAGVMTKAKFDEVVANNAKVTNATHTGDASGSTTLTLQPAAITGKNLASAASNDLVLIADISDGDNLKHTTIQDLVTAGGGGGATNLSEGLVSNISVDINSSTGTSATLAAASTSRAGVMTKAKFDEVVANNAKVTNATHTGDASGSTTLTLQSAAITGKNLAFAASNDLVLIADVSDGDNLKHTTIQDLVSAGGGGGGGITSAFTTSFFYPGSLGHGIVTNFGYGTGFVSQPPSVNYVNLVPGIVGYNSVLNYISILSAASYIAQSQTFFDITLRVYNIDKSPNITGAIPPTGALPNSSSWVTIKSLQLSFPLNTTGVFYLVDDINLTGEPNVGSLNGSWVASDHFILACQVIQTNTPFQSPVPALVIEADWSS